MMRDAKRAARNFRRQELRNVFEDQRVSTRGAEYAREGIAGNMASGLETLRSGGVRGVVGGTGRLQAGATQYLQQEGAQLDEQQRQIEMMQAQDEQRIQAMQEARDNQELQAIQQQLNAGQQTMYSGIGDIAQAGFGAAAMQQQAGLNASEIGLNNAAAAAQRFGANPKVTPITAGVKRLGTGLVAPVFTGNLRGN